MGKESILQKLGAFNQSSVTPFTLHPSSFSYGGLFEGRIAILCSAEPLHGQRRDYDNRQYSVLSHTVSEKYTASIFTVKL
jgi:hypothetical protein